MKKKKEEQREWWRKGEFFGEHIFGGFRAYLKAFETGSYSNKWYVEITGGVSIGNPDVGVIHVSGVDDSRTIRASFRFFKYSDHKERVSEQLIRQLIEGMTFVYDFDKIEIDFEEAEDLHDGKMI